MSKFNVTITEVFKKSTIITVDFGDAKNPSNQEIKDFARTTFLATDDENIKWGEEEQVQVLYEDIERIHEDR